MKWIKKLQYFILLLLLCWQSPSEDLAFKRFDFTTLNWNLNVLEQSLNEASINNEQLKAQLTTLNLQLLEQAKHSSELQLQLQDYETKLKQSKSTSTKWKIGCLSFGATTAVLTTIMILRSK